MITVRFAFDIGDTVTFGPNLKGIVRFAKWDGFTRRYSVRWWDDDNDPNDMWLDETELARPE